VGEDAASYMDSRRRIYPKPPIVEAVIELQFAGSVAGSLIVDALADRLRDKYSVDRERREPQRMFLRSRDGLRVLGCGEDSLSIHVLAPYPGWESFMEQTREAVLALPSEARDLSSVAVRYIDRIAMPSTNVSINDFFTIMPPSPEGMPPQLAGFRVATQMVDPGERLIANLTLASAPADEDGCPVVIYDLGVQRIGQPLCSLQSSEWISIAEALHQRQREIFEASITDRARELFI